MESEKPTPPPENIWLNLGLNVLAPMVILMQGDKVLDNAALVLVIALAFPVGYFGYDLVKRRKANIISIIGFVSVLLSGGIGLLQLPRTWFIIKEAAIPGTIGLAILLSLKTPWPLIRSIFFQPQIFRVNKIKTSLKKRGNHKKFDRLLTQATFMLAGSFFLSSTLNFFVARHFIKTEPSIDPAQFNAEVGAMTGWSFLIIGLPTMVVTFGALFYLITGIQKLTGLEMEEMMQQGEKA